MPIGYGGPWQDGGVALARWKTGIPDSSELRAAKREAVLWEASASFCKNGYHGTSLEDIAGRLNVTKPALYYYFPNKQAMLKACFDQAMESAFKSLDRARQEGGNGREKLRFALAELLDYFMDGHSVAVAVLEEGSLPPEAVRSVKNERRRFEHALRDFVVEGIRDGSIVPCDPKSAILTLLGALSWIPRWYTPDGAWSKAQTKTLMGDLLERMISSEPASALPTGQTANPDM